MKKKLYRSRTDRKLAGICGGLEDFTGVDATLWRVGFVLFTILGVLPGVLAYLLMWIIIPQATR